MRYDRINYFIIINDDMVLKNGSVNANFWVETRVSLKQKEKIMSTNTDGPKLSTPSHLFPYFLWRYLQDRQLIWSHGDNYSRGIRSMPGVNWALVAPAG